LSDFLSQLGRAASEEEELGEHIDEAAGAALDGREPGRALDPRLGLDAETLREAYRPLSAEAKAAITARLAGIVTRSVADVPAEPSFVPAEPSPAPPASARQRSARARWAIGVAPALGVAAALLLWLSSSERPPTAASAALVPYRLELQGSVAATRGSPAAERSAPASEQATRFEIAGSPVVLLLRPDRPSDEAVAAHAYLRAQGALTALAHTVEVAASGALRLTVASETRWPEQGEIVVWVGTANREPEPEQLAADAPSAGPGWQRLERPVLRVTVPQPK
jgi:hypothetical protein